jgi:hypothetical protein
MLFDAFGSEPQNGYGLYLQIMRCFWLSRSLPISIIPVDSRPYGFTYSEWSAKWWQWLLSIPMEYSPAFDSSGANSNINQTSLPVFFLCQTYEKANALPDRTVIIPKNYSIFMPIINWISIIHHDGSTDQELLTVAKEKMNEVANLEMTVNGIQIQEGLEKYRVLSPFFDVMLPVSNIVGMSPGVKRAISDGFWLFFEPRESEVYIASFGSCSSGLTRIGVNYHISFT